MVEHLRTSRVVPGLLDMGLWYLCLVGHPRMSRVDPGLHGTWDFDSVIWYDFPRYPKLSLSIRIINSRTWCIIGIRVLSEPRTC